jgi:hypothetical protein
MRRQRFAGEQLLALQGVSSDTLAAATEALKQAQAGLKPELGGRLGPGSQQERDEGAAARAAAAPVTPTTTTPATAQGLNPTDITRLRSALGIDELLSALRMGGAGFGPVGDTSQFEIPQFEMPEFELPDFSSMFPQQQYGAPGQQPIPEAEKPPVSAKRKSIVKVGSKTYNLANKGGPGLGTADIKAMQQRGWTMGQIKKAAAQAPRVASSAQRMINSAKGKATSTARKVTATAKKAIAKSKKR